MRSIILVLLLAAPLTATDLYPPTSTILPGNKITKPLILERGDGVPGLLFVTHNGVKIKWMKGQQWYSVEEFLFGQTYWNEMHIYGAYCRHQTDETNCVTLYNGTIVLQKIIKEDGWWRISNMQDAEIVDLDRITGEEDE